MSTKTFGRVGCVLLAAVAAEMTAPVFGQVREPPRPQAQGVVKAVDLKLGLITITGPGETRDAAPPERTFTLSKSVEVAIGSALGRGGIYKEGKPADLRAGLRVQLDLAADQKTVESLVAENPPIRGRLTAVDASKLTVTIASGGNREAADQEKTFTVVANGEIAVDEGRGRRFGNRTAKLGELGAGALVTAWLSLDGQQIEAMLAEGPSFFGTVKAVDAAKRTVTVVTRPARGDEAAEEKSWTLAADASVLFDDGRGRRLSVKEGKLADVAVGAAAAVRLSVDQNHVAQVRFEGPALFGMLKTVDADKGTIAVAIPRGRGDAPEEKSFAVAKDARIFLDGVPTTLGNLKAGDGGLYLQLRLSLDQKSVQQIQARQPGSR